MASQALESEYQLLRDAAEPLEWRSLEPIITPSIHPRSNCELGNFDPRRIGLLLGGGTIFSLEDEQAVRVGGSSTLDASAFIREHFPEFSDLEGGLVDPDEVEIYKGLSEDLDHGEMEMMKDKIVSTINKFIYLSNFILFIGSDMTEAVGTYLHNGLANDLKREGVKLYLVWANNPVIKKDQSIDEESLSQIKTGLEATQQTDREGGVYIISNKKVIPTINARKATYDSTDKRPMYYLDTRDPLEIEYELQRRKKVRDLAEKLSLSLYGEDLDTFIRNMVPGKSSAIQMYLSTLLSSNAKAFVLPSLLENASDDKAELFHTFIQSGALIYPRSPKVAVKNVNLSTQTQTAQQLYVELENASSVIFIMNHSLTTSKTMAEAIREVCKIRILEGKPLLAFAVTETGEPRSFNPKTGIYPSAALLRDYVIPLPGHLMPNFVKLCWNMGYIPFEENISSTINFMTTRKIGNNDGEGEIDESLVYRPDVEKVKNTIAYKKNSPPFSELS